MQKFKVFISSTFKDLENFRIKVDSCDIFVGIYAFRYGYIPNGQQKFITELEYERATKSGKNLILYWSEESLL